MVDIKYLKKRGISSGEYKKIFTLPPTDRPPRVNTLVNLIADRIRAGRENNLRDYRTYAAIDLAFDAPFNQTTPTIVQSIINRNLNAEQTLEALKSWGISPDKLFHEVTVDGKKGLMPDPPVFWQVLVPLVKAYTTIRAAKLYNDRNNSPLFPFAPLKNTPEKRLICEIVTDLVETISTWYGYPAVLRDAIQQALKYGVALAFPREEWHIERQVMEDGLTNKTVTVREGLRYVIGHPSRVSVDLQYPMTTINTDTGVEFGMHWGVSRYGDILADRRYWNRNAITYGDPWMMSPAATNYFQEVYPCALDWPKVFTSASETREERSAYYNSSNDRDTAVCKTTMFMKLIPSAWGLGDYRYPVWHRFDVASDDVIIWAAPCAYNPIWMMGYDYDPQAGRQSSFALEAIPWQDHLGNIISQMILTSKQNLANLTFYDTNLVEPKDVEKLKNLGERKYRTLNFIPFDSMKTLKGGLDQRRAFESVKFEFRDVSQMVMVMGQTLNIMERVLQMSSQEVGAAAQHYQSAKEISVTQNATTNRLAYTGSFIDDGIDAWKRQLYEAAMAYMDTDILAQINPDIPDLATRLANLGFEADFEGVDRGVVVRGRKDKLRLEGFARNDNSPYREANMQLAQVIYQTVGAITNNPELFNIIGAKNIIELLQEAAQLSGAPTSFKLRMDPNAQPGGMQRQMQDMLGEAQQKLLEFMRKEVAEPAAQAAAQSDARLDMVEATIKKLMGIYEAAQAQIDKNRVAVEEAQQRMQIKQAEFEAEQARKQQAHELELQRRMGTVAVDAQTKAAQTQADLTVKAAAAKGEAAIAKETASTDISIKIATAQTDMEIARQKAAVEMENSRKQADVAVESTQKLTDAKAQAAKKRPAKTGEKSK